jgi:poly(glycerol-phosphate) alpha-glucosyltransferase
MMFDKRLINYSSVIHFLSDNERNLSLQKIGGLARQKVRVLPNGAAKESLAKPGWRKRFDKLHIHKKNLLFMGRVSKIKGLQDLLVVWQELKPELWDLTIVGPWDDDMLELRKSINDDNSIRVIGPVYGDARFEYLNKADAFILPSYGEGLPTALLEAANNAKVILCSHECNFDSLEKVDGGYFFTCGQPGVNSALNRLFEATADETLRRSSLAYSLARDLYSWDAVGGIWEKEYQRLLDCL